MAAYTPDIGPSSPASDDLTNNTIPSQASPSSTGFAAASYRPMAEVSPLRQSGPSTASTNQYDHDIHGNRVHTE